MRASRTVTVVVAAALAAPSLGITASPVLADAPTYDVLPVPNLPGSYGYSVRQLFNDGKMIGDAFGQGWTHAFYFDGSTAFDLGTLGGQDSRAYDRNASGQIVGVSDTSNGPRAFLWEAGSMTELPTVDGLPAQAHAINDAGQIAGAVSLPFGSRAVMWENGDITDIGTLGGDYGNGIGITPGGVVVGQSTTAGNEFSRIFTYDGSMHDLGAMDGYDNANIQAVTDEGLILGVGVAPSRNCPWFGGVTTLCNRGFQSDIDGPIEPINSLSSDPDLVAYPLGANANGDIVGTYLTDDPCSPGTEPDHCQRGFVYKNGVMTQLPVVGPTQYSGGSGSDITDSGDIIGTTTDGYVLYHEGVGYLLNSLAPDLAAQGFYPVAIAEDGVIAGVTNNNAAYLLVPPGLDFSAPAVTLTSPSEGDVFTLDQAATVAFSCDDGSGTGVASCVGDQPNGATLDTSTAGHFTFSVTTTDNGGNTRTVTHGYDVTAGDVSTTVTGNDQGPTTVTTDPDGVGPSPDVPIQTSVQFNIPSNQQATVRIDLRAPDVSPPSGYSLLGQQVDIDLDNVNPQNGIVITFVIDSSTGADPSTLSIARNADGSTIVLPTCIDTFDPDPCFTAEYTDGPGSDVRLTVYTTHASKWLPIVVSDTTPPSISSTVTGTLGANGWYRSNVGVTWTVSDPESAISSQTGCGATTISTDTAGTTLTCSATSAGGSDSKSVTVKRDATAPTLTCQSATFQLGGSGTVTATVSDAMSGTAVSSVSTAANTTSVGLKSANLSATDRAGNTASRACAYVVQYKLESLKPTAGQAVNRGSAIPVAFRLKDFAGRLISDATASALAKACGAKVIFSGAAGSPGCAVYDAKADTFTFDQKTAKNLAPGTYQVTIRIFAGSDVINEVSTPVAIRS